jgi:YD repeat-containing protein
LNTRGTSAAIADDERRKRTDDDLRVRQGWPAQEDDIPRRIFASRTYDDLGRLITATDERGNATTFEYETGCGCAERVTKVTDALGRRPSDLRCGRSRASVADAAGHTTSYAYDARGHLTTTTYQDGKTEVDAYDARGRRRLAH